VRLGLYIDASYRVRAEDGRVLTNFETLPFLQFGCEVGRHFDGLVLVGRDAPAGGGVDHPLPPGADLAPLPWYPSLGDLASVGRAMLRMLPALWRSLDRVDVVWCFGPHPFSLLLALLALVRRRRVALGVRQDTMAYFRSRLGAARSRRALLAPLWLLDRAWRALGRRVPVVVVGAELEARYGGPRPGLDAMTVSLVREHDIASRPRATFGDDAVRLLSVGRIEPEKNPLLLIDALAELVRRGGPRWSLEWVGTGRLVDAVRARAAELGIADRVELPGFVAPGHELLERYRRADAFVHVAVTEGVPQVLLEAMSTGLPIVATRVGGVERALERGAAGLLVEPHDRDGLVAAVERLAADGEGRRRRAVRGLEIARAGSLEAEAARVAGFLRG
jgi:glycosyltransferase involved in cell wall biosynthesis